MDSVSKSNKKEEPMQLIPAAQRPFTKTNLMMMLGCLALIVIGFLLMSGGGSTVQDGFNPDIFSTRRIVVGPTVAFLGFLLMAFAIIWQPKSNKALDPGDSRSE